MKLSRHFDSDEFRSHDGAPTPDGYLRELRVLCVCFLEPLREEFGRTVILSGHRSASRNEQVNGAPRSRHLDLPGKQGAAADLKCARGTPRQWYDFLDRRSIGGLGLYPWGIHADTRRGRARW